MAPTFYHLFATEDGRWIWRHAAPVPRVEGAELVGLVYGPGRNGSFLSLLWRDWLAAYGLPTDDGRTYGLTADVAHVRWDLELRARAIASTRERVLPFRPTPPPEG